ncbi:MAG: hypothetical protein M4579_004165 [Chaenotheca gracillima]|nr:MAG: hypothetical protein M4579_004165 [Chaenotheca gracillima]
MANRIVIDLSSDDPPPSAPAATLNKGTVDTGGSYYLLLDDSDANEFQDEVYAEKPAKWRRVTRSPSPRAMPSPGIPNRRKPAMAGPDNDPILSPPFSEREQQSRSVRHDLVDFSDPIVLSSSPETGPDGTAVPESWKDHPVQAAHAAHTANHDLEMGSMRKLSSEETAPGIPRLISQYSERTASLLAELASKPRSKTENPGRQLTSRSYSKSASKSRAATLDNLDDPLISGSSESRTTGNKETQNPAPKPVRVSDSNISIQKEKPRQSQDKAVEKQLEKQRKADEKEAEKRRKQSEKEEKAREKQVAAELAEVNRAKTNKKVSTQEMMVELSDSLQQGIAGEQICNFLRGLQVPYTFSPCLLGRVIRWRRKVTARYNEELGHWEPAPLEIKQEKHILCLLYAKDFVDMACADPAETDGLDVDSHVLKLQTTAQDCKVIYLIEGLTAWMRKNKNVRNRAYQAAVRRQIPAQSDEGGAELSTTQRGKCGQKKPAPEYIDEDLIEDCLLRLQVLHNCLIHHTAAPAETAEWISHFTQHISTIPYRSERMNLDTSFCMDVGQVKTGDDPDDTFVKMLQEIVRVTPSIAYGIAGEYHDVSSLVHGLESRGPLALESLKKLANRDGASTNSNIGPAISKRMHKIFLGTDPSSNEV